MSKFQLDSVYLASVHPGVLQPVKLSVGASPEPNTPRSTTYALKPVPRGKKPCVIEVSDAFEEVLDVAASTEAKTRVSNPKLVPCERIAAQLLKDWTGNIVDTGGATPGVIQLVGTVPTEAEKKTMLQMQSAYAESRFQQGERLHREHHSDAIPDECRTMAEWLGRKVIWAQPEMSGETRDCPACYSQINVRATICAHCGSQVKPLTSVLPDQIEAPESEPVTV